MTSATGAASALVERCVRLMAAHSRRSFCALAVITAVASIGLVRLDVTTDRDALVVDGSRAAEDLTRFRGDFGDDETGYVVIPLDDPFTESNLTAYEGLARRLESVPLVREEGGRLESLVGLVGPDGSPVWGTGPAEPSAVRARAEATPFADQRLFSSEPGASYLAMTVRVAVSPTSGGDWTGAEIQAYANDLVDAIAEHSSAGFEPMLASGATFSTAVTDRVSRWLGLGTGLQFLLVALVARFYFGSRAALLPLGVVGVSLVWTLGAMGLLGVPLGALSQLLITLVLVSGVADALHVLHRFGATPSPNEPREAALEAVLEKAPAILFTSLTTAAGFLSFALVGIPSLVEIGLFGALGVLSAMLVTFAVAPAALPWMVRDRTHHRLDRTEAAVVRVTNRAARHAVPIAIGASVLVATSVFGARTIDFELDTQAISGEFDASIELAKIGELTGRADRFELLFERDGEGGVMTPEGLAALQAVQDFVAGIELDGVRTQIEPTVADVVRQVGESTSPDAPESETPASSPSGLGATAIEATMALDHKVTALDRLVSNDLRSARITVTVSDRVEPTALFDQLNPLQSELADLAGPDADVAITGVTYATGAGIDTVLPSVVASFGVALAVIASIVALMLGSVRRGLASMVPNLLPAYLLLAIMGATGVPISLMSVAVGAVVVGMSVDDTVHLVHDAFVAGDPNLSPPEQLSAAIARSGAALVVTSAAVASGLGTFVLLPLAGLAQIGVLGVLAVLLALVGDLILLPAVVKILSPPAPPVTTRPMLADDLIAPDPHVQPEAPRRGPPT